MAPPSKLLAFDAFAKTVEDARVRTLLGGIITLLCFVTILLLIFNEWTEFNTVQLDPEIVVDRDRSKRLDINLDVTFHKLPCDMLTLDIMDVSGELQLDIANVGFSKIRIRDGKELEQESLNVGNNEEGSFMVQKYGPDYCGSCYGARDQSRNEEVPKDQRVCCNLCELLKQAYVEVGWAFYDGKDMQQCEEEGYVAKIQDRLYEGCRIKGTTNVNRVAGNLHVAPGASFTGGNRHIHDLSLYGSFDHFSMEHTINHLSFGADPALLALNRDYALNKDKNQNMENLMFSTHPLDGHSSKKDAKNHVFTYFIKVVASRYEFLNHQWLETNQFSATKHERPIEGGKDEDHQHKVHLGGGHPAVFFNLEISPIKIINREEYEHTWGTFFLGVCSAIGGVLTIGAVLDRMVYEGTRAIRGKKDT